MNIIDKIDQEQMRFDLPDFRPGDTVKVHIRIIEGNKERVQIFQGVVLKRKRGKMDASFTVRKISHASIGVEKTFALHSPRIETIEVVSEGRVRRSRLYYLRDLRGKAARIRERGRI
ncbi:MAG: 50S ribosomal protein L19 [Candidatus Electrothrix sp. GM3_4]|nr:50S ribosomal protein L19 [Candidatus Electrothrix sp. GM3_4]